MTWKAGSASLMLALASAAPAVAEQAPAMTQRQLVRDGPFQQWDRNQDQRLDAAEFRADPYLFAEFDADGDLLLTEDEFYRHLFRYLDKDGSGGLDPAEAAELDGWR